MLLCQCKPWKLYVIIISGRNGVGWCKLFNIHKQHSPGNDRVGKHISVYVVERIDTKNNALGIMFHELSCFVLYRMIFACAGNDNSNES